jgi:hypothetical protein
MAEPLVVAVEMGLGHLRAADAVARALGVPLERADRAPLAGRFEEGLWEVARTAYERLSRLSQATAAAPIAGVLLDALTAIPPLHPARDLARPSSAVLLLDRLIATGLGRGLAAALAAGGARPLFTTYFAAALAAERHGAGDVSCLVTDSDLARAWVARDPARSRVRYFAPSDRVVRRLAAYGVPSTRVSLTGFPLPERLLGGPELPALKRNLAARLVRLDPSGALRGRLGDEIGHALGPAAEHEREHKSERPPLLVFAVGGAGAQLALADRFLPSLAPLVDRGRLELALLCAPRRSAAARFEDLIKKHRLTGYPNLRIVSGASLDEYFTLCEQLFARADVLWTKPSELTFYAALGLPLVLSPPVGVQETYNFRWAVENGAALAQHAPAAAADWLREWLESGTLAGAAWNGFTRLPKRGLYRIVRALTAGGPLEPPARERSHATRANGASATRSSGT